MTKIVLEIRKPNQPAVTKSFEDGKYTIGRESGDIVLEDSLVSSRHAEISIENGGVTFKDLNSTNGSYLESGEKITGSYVMNVGRVIRMGHCAIMLKNIDSPEAMGKTMLAPAGTLPSPAVAEEAKSQMSESGKAEPKAHGSLPMPSEKSEHSGQTSQGFEGLFNDFVDLLKYAFNNLKSRIIPLALPILILTIPVPLIIAIMGIIMSFAPLLGALVLVVTWFLSVLITIPINAVVVLFIYPVIARYMTALYRGEPITMKEAWKQHRVNLGSNVLNTFVTTLIGALTLGIMGVYVFQIPHVEGKTMFDVNARSFELLKLSWKRVLIVIIGSWLLFFIPALIVSSILGYIPILGAIVNVCVWSALHALYVPTMMLILTRIYFETRRTFES